MSIKVLIKKGKRDRKHTVANKSKSAEQRIYTMVPGTMEYRYVGLDY